jgi:hypothetical protein
MAKRRKSHKAKRRHHRVGAMRGIGGAVRKAAAIAAGAVAGSFLNSVIKKAAPTLPPWAGGAAVAGAGIVLPKFVKSPIVGDVATGIVAAGALFAINESFLSLPGIAGLGAVPKTMGYRTTPKLQATVNGRSTHRVGAPGFMDRPINGVRDMQAIGALYDN